MEEKRLNKDLHFQLGLLYCRDLLFKNSFISCDDSKELKILKCLQTCITFVTQWFNSPCCLWCIKLQRLFLKRRKNKQYLKNLENPKFLNSLLVQNIAIHQNLIRTYSVCSQNLGRYKQYFYLSQSTTNDFLRLLWKSNYSAILFSCDYIESNFLVVILIQICR